MKRFLPTARLLALSLCISLLVSCGPKPGTSSGSVSGSASGSSSGSASASQSAAETPPLSREERIREMARNRVRDLVKEAAAIVTANPVKGESTKVTSYKSLERTLYQGLTDSQKKVYDTLLVKVQNLEPFAYTAKEDGHPAMNDLVAAAYALSWDYPLYDCYYNLNEVMDGLDTAAVEVRYFFPTDPDMIAVTSPDELENLREEIDIFKAQCQAIVDGMPENLSAYDQYRYLATYISLCTEYDYDRIGGPATYTAYGAIQSGFSVCQGYALGLLLLCQTADLWCTHISGSIHREDGFIAHSWNLVQLEDGTYHVDVTWSDNGFNSPDHLDWFRYFMINQEHMTYDHIVDQGTRSTGSREIVSPYGPVLFPEPEPAMG